MSTDDLIQGAVKYLAAQPGVVAVLGSSVDNAGNPYPYLFQHDQWAGLDGSTFLEGSGSTAAVVRRAGSWSGGNPHNRLRFPRIAVDIWADPQRNAAMNVTAPGEVYHRMETVYFAIDDRLHRPTGETQMWGDVRTIGCLRLGEPTEPDAVADGDGLLRQTVYYAVSQG